MGHSDEIQMLIVRKDALIKRLSGSNSLIKKEIFFLKQLIEERDRQEIGLIQSKKALKKMKETSLNLKNSKQQWTIHNVHNKEITEEQLAEEQEKRERKINAVEVGLKNVSNKYMDIFVKYGQIEDQISESYRNVKDLELECLDILQKLDTIREVLGEKNTVDMTVPQI